MHDSIRLDRPMHEQPLRVKREKEDLVRVGVVPPLVAAGGPDARDQVIAYAQRIDKAWSNFWAVDVTPWMDKNGLGKGSQPDSLVSMRSRRDAFYDYVFGPSDEDGMNGPPLPLLTSNPLAVKKAWEDLEGFDNRLRYDRTMFGLDFAPVKSTLEPLSPMSPTDKPVVQVTPVPGTPTATAKEEDSNGLMYVGLATAAVVAGVLAFKKK